MVSTATSLFVMISLTAGLMLRASRFFCKKVSMLFDSIGQLITRLSKLLFHRQI